MRFAGYIATGYVLVFGAIAAYAARLAVRGRHLARQLPREEHRWR